MNLRIRPLVVICAIAAIGCYRYGPSQPVTVTYAGATSTTVASATVPQTATAAPSTSSSAKTSIDADAVIAKNRWRFKACYTAALKIDKNAGGTVRVKVHIGSAGEVTSAEAETTTLDPVLTKCIVDAFPPMQFPEPVPAGNTATFTVPVILTAKK